MSDLVTKFGVFWSTLTSSYWTSMFFLGLWNTIKIAVCGLFIGIVIGTLIALVKVMPKYKLYARILDKVCTVYVALFRGTPMVVQLLVAYYVLLPALGINGVEAINVGIVVFGLNSGAYVSEIMRGGINSVDAGQMEAGRAVGLGYGTVMLKVVIPQAVKNILPTLGNEFITLIKETSVLSFITVVDLYNALRTIATANQNYEFIIPYIILGAIYIVLVLIITLLVKLVEKFFSRSDRKTTEVVKKKQKAKV